MARKKAHPDCEVCQTRLANQKVWAKAKYDRLQASGRCIKCQAPTVSGIVRCQKCANLANDGAYKRAHPEVEFT